MRRLLTFTLCFVLLVMATIVPASAGEVIDGVVASVNRYPILRSDWDEAARFEAFMQQRPAGQMTDSERTLALRRLIDRQLLIAQMGTASYMQPSNLTLGQEIAKLRTQIPNGSDDTVWQRLLTSYELTEELLRQHLSDEVQVMNFIDARLRPNVHVNEEEVESYYKKQLIPELQQNGGKIVPLDVVKSRISELLTQQRIEELLDTWLHNLRQQAEIRSLVAIPGVNTAGGGSRAAGMN